MYTIIAIGFYTIWFTPIVFVCSLIGAIKAIKEERETKEYTIACSISFMMIIIPMFLALTQG